MVCFNINRKCFSVKPVLHFIDLIRILVVVKRVCIYILLLFLCCRLHAQNGYKVVSYSANDGLPSSLAYRVFQDSRDFLWIGTDAGLSRFNGQKFVNYAAPEGLPGNLINGIDEDNKGNLWIATNIGLYRFNGHKFYEEHRIGGTINNIVCVDSDVWIGAREGLYKYRDGQLATYTAKDGLTNTKVSCFLPLDDGSMIIGTGNGLTRYSKTKGFEKMWSPAGSADGYIMNIAKDQAGRIWFCTLMGGIYYYYHNQLVTPPYDSLFSFPKSFLIDGNRVLVAHDQHFSIFEDGIYKGNLDGLFPKDNIRTGMIKVIRDRSGTMWMCTNSGLLSARNTNIKTYQMPPRVFTNYFKYTKAELEKIRYDKTIEGLHLIAGDSCIYIDNASGLYKFCGDSIVATFTDKPLQDGDVPVLEQAKDGTYFFGAGLGPILIYRKGKYSLFPSKDRAVSSLHVGNDLWIGCLGRLIKYTSDGKLIRYTIKDSIAHRMFCLAPYDNGILIGSLLGVLYFKNDSFHKLSTTIQQPLLIRDIYDCKDGSFLLASKGHGLIHVKIRNDSIHVIRTLSSKNGLNNNFIHKVDVYDNIVWATTFNGMFRIRNFFNHKVPPDVEFLDRNDGLLDNNWVTAPMFIDKKGFVYVGGSQGLMKFHTSINFGDNTNQKTYVTGVKVNNTDYKWNINDSLIPFSGVPDNYEFRHKENSLTFYYTGINFYRASRIRYEYVLLGYSDKPVVTNTNYVTFNNLEPGNYIFRVRSTTNQAFASEPYSSFAFEIEMPFWQTWWFRSLILVSIGGVIYAIYRWRLAEQMKKQQKEIEVHRQITETKILAFQARMNPHFIFNSLNSIQYFITNNDKLATLNYLSKFARLLRQILDNTANSRITLEKEIEMLRSYIEMEELRFEHKFSYTLIVDESISVSEIMIPGMVIQPFIENAILHGLLHKTETGLLNIHFKTNGRQIICIVEDNGVGRSHSHALNQKKITQHKSHGTAIAINRLQLHNDEERGLNNNVIFEDLVLDGAAAGTKVIIYIPIL